MRLYTFTNFYLSPIQRGIQTAHLVHELFIKYPVERGIQDREAVTLINWAGDYKTIIVLNGGDQVRLKSNFGIMAKACMGLGLPYTQFHEDAGLNKALTVTGFVCPESIYTATPESCEGALYEGMLYDLISNSELA